MTRGHGCLCGFCRFTLGGGVLDAGWRRGPRGGGGIGKEARGAPPRAKRPQGSSRPSGPHVELRNLLAAALLPPGAPSRAPGARKHHFQGPAPVRGPPGPLTTLSLPSDGGKGPVRTQRERHKTWGADLGPLWLTPS